MPADPDTGGARQEATSSLERRRNVLFRSLIDEMIGQFRELQSHAGPWSDEERARAEADLERIMSQVRNEAFRPAD